MVVEETVGAGLRSSATLHVTVMVPGCAPALSRVAVEVLLFDVSGAGGIAVGQPGPSGLLALEVMVELPPIFTLPGFSFRREAFETRSTRSVVEDDIQQRAVNAQFAVVLNEP